MQLSMATKRDQTVRKQGPRIRIESRHARLKELGHFQVLAIGRQHTAEQRLCRAGCRSGSNCPYAKRLRDRMCITGFGNFDKTRPGA